MNGNSPGVFFFVLVLLLGSWRGEGVGLGGSGEHVRVACDFRFHPSTMFGSRARGATPPKQQNGGGARLRFAILRYNFLRRQIAMCCFSIFL